ncbi:NAD(P)/FAD-dependent oxidoreductase [Kribbella pittospori]|uniref:NAD(P)/FAD-dependent oxidoreductase n=1 Tax=Kribbella pittospori TaxID=722689 RepID=A0A4R0JN20_9ACTN|nr:NAD(P)/FAD-dependent oxidoreductase [Kribbella pittospori]TCC46316.1 NAD(P)/FAD-dependent oxidoreductase [Kribbella pittospori]
MNTYEVAVIGGSAAGLSAALVLSRARRRVVVLDSGSPRNQPARHMHGFLSRDGVPPADLVAAGRDEVARYGSELVDAVVTDVIPNGTNGFWVITVDGRRFAARRLLVATGLRDELPAIDGLADRWARDVLHCPYCHGWEVRDQQLGVIGGTPNAVRYAQIVRQWSHDVVYFTPTGSLTAIERAELVARAIGIVEGDVRRVVIEHDRLHGLEMTDGRAVPRDALFVPPRFVPNSGLLARLGCELDDDGWPAADSTGLTSVAGVWVAGNVANPRAQVITAAGEGSTAAIAINADLVAEDVRDALHHRAIARASN